MPRYHIPQVHELRSIFLLSPEDTNAKQDFGYAYVEAYGILEAIESLPEAPK